MALEILARIMHLFVNSRPTKVTEYLSPLSTTVKSHLSDRKSIIQLLNDMRPVLNQVNESNANIISFPISKISLRDVLLSEASWLDCCKDIICFFSDIMGKYIKLSSKLMTRCFLSKTNECELTVIVII
jgi:hypothetical protein